MWNWLYALLGLQNLEELIMAFKEDVDAKFAALMTKIDEKSAEFVVELEELKAAIGETVSEADKADVLAKFDAVISSFTGKFDIDPSKPEPPVEEPPVEPTPEG
jgi:hypothetical protein